MFGRKLVKLLSASGLFLLWAGRLSSPQV